MSWLRAHWVQVVVVAAFAAILTVLNRVLPAIDVQSALHDISNAIGAFAYGLAGLAAFLETGAFVGLLLPGETVVILAGAVAGQGATLIWLTIIVVWLGAFAGDSTSFVIGRRLGREFALHRGARLGITRDRLATVERYFERYGGRTIVIASFPSIGESIVISSWISPAITARYVFRIARDAKSADSSAAATRLRAKTTTPLVGVSRR